MDFQAENIIHPRRFIRTVQALFRAWFATGAACFREVSGRMGWLVRDGPCGSRFKYNVHMKTKFVVTIIVAGMMGMMAAARTLQNTEGKEPLFFARIAADVAGNVQNKSLNGFIAIYIEPKNWAAGLKDSDLGPFMKMKEAKAGRSAVCLFSDTKDTAICVYFDGDAPFGVAAVAVGASRKIEDKDVAAAYKAVTKEMLKKGDAEFSFAPSDVNTDDGTPLPGFQITSTAKSKS